MTGYDEIVGHERVKGVLRRAVQNDRVHHAYLFSGPEGVGKTPTALAFAAALNCTDLSGGDACGRCASCRKTRDGNHPDLWIVEPEKSMIKIDQIRDLQHRAQFAPYEGKRKVYLLRSADLMNPNAANALLKTLEEPRDATVFVLIADNPHLLPMTVLSRCQRVAFWPLLTQELARELEDRLELEPEQARLVALLSNGSLGRALGMEIESLLDRRRAVLEIVSALSGAGPTRALGLAEEMIEDDPSELCEIVKTWYRDQIVWKTTGREDALVNRDMVQAIQKEASGAPLPALFEKVRAIGQTQFWLGFSANRKMALESLALTLAG